MPYCSFCGNLISELARACPKCGHPNEVPAPAEPVEADTSALAGFWPRAAAWLIDALVVGLASSLFASQRYATGSQIFVGSSTSSPWVVIGFLYAWLMIGLANGQTLGKMAMGIRIATPQRTRVTLGASALRAVVGIGSGLALGIGYLWAIWDPQRRTWHDMAANTRAFKL
jgi:uncharacterized RDD family membrane protein YckC